MALLTDKLYHRIIQAEAPRYRELRVISGYGSASFLKKIKQEFPDLKVTLFLGMTSQGISERNHKGFVEVSNQYEDVQIFYEVEGKPNHMKIVEFLSEKSKKTFIGSANFTENGFINQREVMTLVNEYTTSLFDYQRKLSLLCTDKNIEKYIVVYPDYKNPEEELEGAAENRIYVKKNNIKRLIEEEERNHNSCSNKLVNIRRKANPQYYNKFDIEVVLESKNNPRWLNTGINAWVDDKVPILMQTPRLLFDKIFPTEEMFEIISEDGHKYLATLTGRFNGSLKLINGNFYEYVKKHIGLDEYRPISHEDLKAYGNTKIHFERLDKLKYIMSFELND